MEDKRAAYISWAICIVGFIVAIAFAFVPEPSIPVNTTYIPNTVQAATSKPQYLMSDDILDTSEYSYVVSFVDIYGTQKYFYFRSNNSTWMSKDVLNTRYDGNFYTQLQVGDGSVTFANGTCIIKVESYFVITTSFIFEQL